ncbi:MAG: hypothetical protein ACXAEN_26990, partial [Candidatus Thorarchaeota archaeon]|jgi:hypothetical protein
MEGEAGSVFATLAHTYASFANCKNIIEFWNHFMLINFNDGNQNIRSLAFASAGDIDEWTIGTSGANTLTDSIGEINDVVKLGADLILYSEHSVTTCRYRGGSVLFTFPTLIYRTGTLTANSSWGTATVHYFVGTDQKIYMYAGGAHLFGVGKPIDRSFFAEADISKKQHMVTGYDPGRDRLHFCFARPQDTYAQAAYVINRREEGDPWEYYEFANTVRSYSIFENQSDWYCDDSAWSGIYCDEIDLYCDDAYTQSGYPISVFLSGDGYVFRLDEITGSDNGTEIACDYHTQDLTVDREEHFGRWLKFGFTAKSGIASSTVDVFYSTDGGDSWTEFNDSPVTLTSDWATTRLGFDAVSRKVRFKFYQKSTTDLQIRNDMHVVVLPRTARD